MADKSIVSNSKLDALAKSIAEKAGASLPLTVDGMKTAVDGIEPGGGGEDYLEMRMRNTLRTYTSANANTLPDYIFSGCSQLKSVSFTDATLFDIGEYAFFYSGLMEANFPNATLVKVRKNAFNTANLQAVDMPIYEIGDSAFKGNSQMSYFRTAYAGTSLLPVGMEAFSGCTSLKVVDFATAPAISYSAFLYCSGITDFIIRDTVRIATIQSSTFGGSSVKSGTAKIWVPDALVEDYKAATNWSVYASQIHPLSEYTEE